MVKNSAINHVCTSNCMSTSKTKLHFFSDFSLLWRLWSLRRFYLWFLVKTLCNCTYNLSSYRRRLRAKLAKSDTVLTQMTLCLLVYYIHCETVVSLSMSNLCVKTFSQYLVVKPCHVTDKLALKPSQVVIWNIGEP